MKPLSVEDPQIAAAIQAELERQRNNIILIASENFASRAVMEAQGCIMTNKYAEGYPEKRFYQGCQYLDKVEAEELGEGVHEKYHAWIEKLVGE